MRARREKGGKLGGGNFLLVEVKSDGTETTTGGVDIINISEDVHSKKIFS